MHKSSIYLTDRLKARLASRSAESGRSEADLIRAALEESLCAPTSAEEVEKPVPGRLVGVGVGPGDPTLLTVRALQALRRADVVAAPSTASDSVGRAESIVRQALPGLRVVRVPFAMSRSRTARDRSVRSAAAEVVSFLGAGEEVAWITLGDPLVYSTFPSVAAEVRRRRPSTVVEQVPGIMAFQALAARTGTVVADEREAVVVRTALDGEPIDSLLAGANGSSTLVVYKGGRRLPELAAALQPGAEAVAGELLGLPGERIGPLESLASAGPASYLATVIVPAGGRA